MLTGALFSLARPLFQAMDPERAHGLAIAALKAGIYPRADAADDPRLAVRVWGLDFSNPLGMAAGFDKNGEVPSALLALGFAFVEIGTVTPRPQQGNPRPRIFRLPQDAALINRLGFNSDGHAAVRERLRSLARRGGVVGVNIGANKDSADRIADYARGLEAFWGLADYFTVNISSPNTPDLRRLQARGELVTLLTSLNEARDRLTDAMGKRTPVLIKIAPDVTERELEDIAEACLAHGADGVIVSNTTISRDGLASAHASEAGGLSGAPLFALSTRVLARLHRLTEGRLPLVGVGGVTSGEAAYAKIKAGASLVQLYTALTYQGPALIARIKRDLVAFMERDGITSIGDATGVEAERYAQ